MRYLQILFDFSFIFLIQFWYLLFLPVFLITVVSTYQRRISQKVILLTLLCTAGFVLLGGFYFAFDFLRYLGPENIKK